MIVTESGYQLEANGLALMENDSYSDSNGFLLEAMGADSTFGNGIPVAETVLSLLRDGDLTSTTRYGNRTASFLVTVKAEHYQGLADGEATIAAVLDRPGELVWRVPGNGPVTIFDIVRSWSEFVFEDLSETMRLVRTFRVTFECLPDGRSVEERSFTWTGPSAVLKPTTSVTGWAVSSGTRSSVSEGGGVFSITATANPVTFTVAAPDFPLDDFLWIRTNNNDSSGIDDIAEPNITVNGVVIPNVEVFNVGLGVSDKRYLLMADVSQWRGQTVPISFTMQAATSPKVYGFATTSYPNLPVAAADIATFYSNPTPNGTTRGPALPNFGIGVVHPFGSSRAPCHLSFTAPAGGAFVYTAPDPVAALRSRGLPENIFGAFDITDVAGDEVEFGATVMWFPEGEHQTQVGRTEAQPLVLFPNGVWPQAGTGVTTIGDDATGSAYAYPADPDAALSFYTTSGAKNLVSPSPTLPMGYHGGAVAHENHVLHPVRSGFAVLDVNGAPISTTVTYYPRWKHHAAS